MKEPRAKISKLDESVKDPYDDRLVKYYGQFFITLFVVKFRKLLMKQLESARARVKQLESTTAKLESTKATVELFKRTEETLIIKCNETDPTPVRLTVNKHVSLISGSFKRSIISKNIPGIGRLFAEIL